MTPSDTVAGMSVEAFSKLVGTSRVAVVKAIKSGRVAQGVGRDSRGHPVILDAELAAAEFERNRDTSQSRGNAPRGVGDGKPAAGAAWPQSTGDARRAQIMESTRKLRIANDMRERELVPRREFLLAYAGLVTQAKTVFLGLPSRAKQRMPHLTVEDVAILDLLVREGLEHLAEGCEDTP